MATEVSSIEIKNGRELKSGWMDAYAGWLTLAAFLAIVVLTLMPFQFSAQATALRRVGPFLTWFAPVGKDPIGWFLNVLLFVPLGFGLAWWEGERGCSRRMAWSSAIVLGLLLSFSVEFLQLYIPVRDSSWDDVFMNTLGSGVGVWLYEKWGPALLDSIEEAFSDLSDSLSR